MATITKSNANSCDGLEQWRSFFKRGEGMSSNTIVAGLEVSERSGGVLDRP